MIDIRSMTENELEQFVAEYGEKPYRARQLFAWIHKNHVNSLSECKNLPKNFLAKISENAHIAPVCAIEVLTSQFDETRKYLFEMENKAIIESVRMKQSYGNTVCISTQAGCNMACAFCASAIGGKGRDLTAGEMAGQVYAIEDDIRERVSNVVLMGSGEPLDNYDNTIKLLSLLNAESGANISQRNITISTCGLANQIQRLANELIHGKTLQITLAVSLHAPNDAIRRTIMPVAKKYPFDVLLSACRQYIEKTKRRITFEYALMEHINDAQEHALELSAALRGMLCHVNLIPVNNVDTHPFTQSGQAAITRFEAILRGKGIEASVRKERGADIDAACGQLRRRYESEKN